MTVGEFFIDERIDSNFIEQHFDGSYWESCNSFVTENWGRDMDSLSQKQSDWLFKIREDCVEKRIEG